MPVLLAIVLGALVGAPQATPTRDHLDAMRHLRLGQENMHAEQWDKAEAEFQWAIKLEPPLEMAHYGLGQVYMATKRFPEAVKAYLGCRDAFVSNTARRANNDQEVVHRGGILPTGRTRGTYNAPPWITSSSATSASRR